MAMNIRPTVKMSDLLLGGALFSVLIRANKISLVEATGDSYICIIEGNKKSVIVMFKYSKSPKFRQSKKRAGNIYYTYSWTPQDSKKLMNAKKKYKYPVYLCLIAMVKSKDTIGGEYGILSEQQLHNCVNLNSSTTQLLTLEIGPSYRALSQRKRITMRCYGPLNKQEPLPLSRHKVVTPTSEW